MNRSVLRGLLVGGALLLFVNGCATKAKPIERTVLAELDQDPITEFGKKSGEAMLEAVKAGDFEAFTAPMSDEVRAKYPAKAFEGLHGGLKNIEKIEYLSELSTPVMKTYAWKLTRTALGTTPENEGQVFKFDLLFMLRVAKVDGEYKVLGFNFMP